MVTGVIEIIKQEIEKRIPVIDDLRTYAKKLHGDRFPDKKIKDWIRRETLLIANEAIYKAKEGCMLYNGVDEIKTKSLGVKNLKITNINKLGFTFVFVLEGLEDNQPVSVILFDHDLFIALEVFIDNWLTKYISEGKQDFTFYRKIYNLFNHDGSIENYIEENVDDLIQNKSQVFSKMFIKNHKKKQ